MHQYASMMHLNSAYFTATFAYFCCVFVLQNLQTLLGPLGESRNSSGKSASTWVVGLGVVCVPARMMVNSVWCLGSGPDWSRSRDRKENGVASRQK